MSSSKKKNSKKKERPDPGYIKLSKAAEFSPYSQEYLSLLARKGKIHAQKFGRNWYTTKKAINDYLNKQGIKIILPKHLFNASYKGKINQPFDFSSISEPASQREPKISFAATGEGFPGKETPEEELAEEPEKEETISPELEEEPQEKYPVRTMMGDIEKSQERGEEKIERVKEIEKKPERIEKAEARKEPISEEEKILERLLTALGSRLPPRRGFFGKIGDFDKKANQLFYSPTKSMLIAVLAVVVTLILVGGISFGNLDKAILAIHKFFKDAETLEGHWTGTHANEVLLLNKEGNISIYGHIETQGQLRSWVREGIAPIVVDSTTTVENLSVDYLDNLSNEDFTLAFVTKNGNITYEDVKLEGNVEVGKELIVKGATKLLDSLFVYGDLGAFGDIVGEGNLEIAGSAKIDKELLALGGIKTKGSNLDLGAGTIILTNRNLIKNLNAEMVGGYHASDFDLDLILSHGSSSSRSMNVGGIWAPIGVFSNSLISQGHLEAFGSFRLGSSAYDIGIIETKNWSISTEGNITTDGSLSVAELATFTGDPSGTGISEGAVYINSSSADTDYTIFGVAVDGTEKFKIDAEGDVTVVGNLSSQGTSTFFGAATFNDDVTLTSPANLTLNAGNITVSKLSPPDNPSATATTGGNLTAGTYYYKITALNSNGETKGSSEVSETVDGTTSNAIEISWDEVTGASSYRIYRGTVSEGQDVYFEDNDGPPFLDTGETGNAGTVPTENTTGGEGTFANGLTILGTTVSRSILPETDSFYNLGSPTLAWANLYADNLVAGGADISGDVSIDGDLSFIGDRNISGTGTLTLNPTGNLYFQSTSNYIDESGNLVITGSFTTPLTITSNYLPTSPTDATIIAKPAATDPTYRWLFDGVSSYTDTGVMMGDNDDIKYYGFTNKFTGIYLSFSTFGVGYNNSWEYSKGSGVWGSLSVTDDTNDFTSNGNVYFSSPSDWAQDIVNGTTAYFIRVSTSTNPTITAISSANYILPTGYSFATYLGPQDTTPKFYVDYRGNVQVATLLVANDLEVSGYVQSHLIPLSPTKTYDLGSPSLYWRNAYIDVVNANNIVATATEIAGTKNETFTIDSDNTGPDQDMALIFNRGSDTFNAILGWDATAHKFTLNAPLEFSSDIGTATLTIPGDINTTGGGFLTNSTLRLDNAGNLQNIGTYSASTTLAGTTSQDLISATQTNNTTGGIQRLLVLTANGTEAAAVTETGILVDYSGAGTGTTGISVSGWDTSATFGDGTDHLSVSDVGDLTFVDADDGASITGPAGGALTISAGASQALTLTATDLDIDSGTIDLDSQATGIDLIDNTVNALSFETSLLSLDTQNSNVGIGTTSPGDELDVDGGIQGDYFQPRSDALDTYSTLRVYNSSTYAIGMKSAQSFGGLSNWAMTFTMNDDATRGFLWRDINDAADDGAMSLTTSGILTVKSDTTIGGDLTVSGGDVDVTGAGADGVEVTGSVEPGLRLTNSSYAQWDIFSGGGGSTNYDNDLTFYRRSGASGDVIFQHGNVGIGTSGPGTKLEVAGQIKITGGTPGAGKVLTSDATGLATWETLSALPSGTSGQTLRHDGTNWVANSVLFNNGTNVGIGTTGPDRKLDVLDASNPQLRLSQTDGTVYTDFQMTSAGDLVMAVDGQSNQLVLDDSGNVGIGTSGPSYNLDVVSGGSTTARFGTDSEDEVVIGDGSGKLTTGTVDPLFNIGGNKYATYLPGMTGVKEETAGVVQLTEGKYVIDFDESEEGSDLWIFYRVTDFGENWRKLVIVLGGEGPGEVWYQKNPAENQLVLYSENSTSISYRLTAPRFDWQSWLNVVEDGTVTGLVVGEVINDQYTQTSYNNELHIEQATSTDEQIGGQETFFDEFVVKLKGIVSTVMDTITGLPKLIVDGILEVKNDILAYGAIKRIIQVPKKVTEVAKLAFDGITLEVEGSAAEASKLEILNEDENSINFQTYSMQTTRDEITVTGSSKFVRCDSYDSETLTKLLSIVEKKAQVFCSNQEVIAIVLFDPSFTSIIDSTMPIKVLTTATSPVLGNIYVAGKSINGFVAKELHSQDVGVTFDWMVVAKIGNPEEVQETSSESGSPQISPDPTTEPNTESTTEPNTEPTSKTTEPTSETTNEPTTEPFDAAQGEEQVSTEETTNQTEEESPVEEEPIQEEASVEEPVSTESSTNEPTTEETTVSEEPQSKEPETAPQPEPEPEPESESDLELVVEEPSTEETPTQTTGEVTIENTSETSESTTEPEADLAPAE
jgi:hypothetical protein